MNQLAEHHCTAVDQLARTARDIQEWIASFIAKEMKLDIWSIDLDADLSQYGFDSALALTMLGELEEFLGRELAPTLAYNYPTIAKLASHLAQR